MAKGIREMEHMKDMQPEEVYNLLWGKEEEGEIRQGDKQEEVQEDDFSNLPRTVERVVKEGLRTGYIYKRYTGKDGTVKEYKTGETKLYVPFDKDDETQVAQVKLMEKYRDAGGIEKAFMWHQLNIDRELELQTEEQDSGRYDFREHIKTRWAEVNNHICPRCGGTIYQNVETPRRIYKGTGYIEPNQYADLKIAGYDKPFGDYKEFRCGNCLTSLWYCEDCRNFHYTLQENCNIPSVQYELAMHAHDSDKLDMCETFDPAFDMFWHNEDDYKDPMLRTLRDELLKHGDQQVFKYEHTRLNQWLREAELIRQKKTGRKTLDIHNYAYAPQRDHAMTQLEKDLFKIEINAFRISRGEYRTGTKIFVKSKTSESIERGTVYCSGYYTMPQEKLEEIEHSVLAQVEACA